MTRREAATANFMKGDNWAQSVVLAYKDIPPLD